jgi:TPP-dependent pyruvate/acetoin dehydrogenase alpha subunit
MKNLPTPQELIDFENDIAASFANKEIRAPIHLNYGNEKQTIEIFKTINPEDWCLGTWRTHYMCLCKGIPKEQLKKDILAGRSISLCYKDYNIVSSAIVGGIIPIAVGVAMDIKRKKQKNRAYCFVGDMSATTGLFNEAYNYAFNFDLPLTFIVEDNGKSVCTNTRKVWNCISLPNEPFDSFVGTAKYENGKIYKSPNFMYYKYENEKYPHAGGTERVQF